MRVPQVTDRIKEAPAVALRGLLAGVGQLLLITDRLRNKTGADDQPPQAGTPDVAEGAPEPVHASTATAEEPLQAPEAATPAAATPAAATPAAATPAAATPAAATPAAATPKKRSPGKRPDKTGNVRLLSEKDAEDSGSAAAEPAAAAEPVVAAAEPVVAAAEPVVAAASEAAGNGSTAGEEPNALPLANYDELSVASLRARLRNLTAAQVAELVEYEKAHADRSEVVTMFERRIAKLEAGG